MKWTKEECQKEALKYNYRNDFRNKSASSYRISIKNNWLDEICSHMLNPYEINMKWTKEKCQEEALKYNTKYDFKKGNSSAYNSSYSNGWLNEICSHMIQIYKPKNYWTKEKCQEESLKYDNRTDFKNNSRVCYNKALKLGFLSEICGHMKFIIYYKKTKNKLKINKKIFKKDITIDMCKKEALKYSTRTEFYKKCSSYYTKSLKSGWLDEICKHMKISGNRFNRCIYAYEFSDNHVYIGLTYNLKNRHNRHMSGKKQSSVLTHIKNTGLQPNLIQLSDYILVDDASILEGKFIEKYKQENWIILNKIKSGGVGGNTIKWNKEKCQEEALKYKSKTDFIKYNGSAYASAYSNKWLSEICSHMKEAKKPNGYWNKERCAEEAVKYNKITQFSKNSKSAYNSARRNKWLDEICSHMKYRK